MGYPARNQQGMDFGPWPDPVTSPRPPRLAPIGLWVVEVPGKPSIYRLLPHQADAVFGWELGFWKGLGYYEEVHGDLYDRRTGKRLRHGYRELFYQINDGHQLRATLRFMEDNVEGRRYVFITDEGTALCRHCARMLLHDLIFALRHRDEYTLRVIGTELRYSQPLHCEHCGQPIPAVEDQS